MTTLLTLPMKWQASVAFSDWQPISCTQKTSTKRRHLSCIVHQWPHSPPVNHISIRPFFFVLARQQSPDDCKRNQSISNRYLMRFPDLASSTPSKPPPSVDKPLCRRRSPNISHSAYNLNTLHENTGHYMKLLNTLHEDAEYVVHMLKYLTWNVEYLTWNVEKAYFTPKCWTLCMKIPDTLSENADYFIWKSQLHENNLINLLSTFYSVVVSETHWGISILKMFL